MKELAECLTFGNQASATIINQSPLDMEMQFDMEIKRDELQQAIVFYDAQLGMQRQRMTFFIRQLEPIQKSIPDVLKNYLVNNAHKIDYESLTPLSRLTLQKYLFYKKAATSVSLLIEKIVEKLYQMKTQAQELHISLPNSVQEESTLFKKPLPKRFRRKVPEKFGNYEHIFMKLPSEVFQKIIGNLNLDSLKQVCLVDKSFYQFAGNDHRWRSLCENIGIADPKPCLQTWKNVFALYQLGKRKCQQCRVFPHAFGTKTGYEVMIGVKRCEYPVACCARKLPSSDKS